MLSHIVAIVLTLSAGARGPSEPPVTEPPLPELPKPFVPKVKILRDAATLALGQEVYTASCAACHKDGVIGPRLDDAKWKYGGKPKQVLRTVALGVPARGMPGWSRILPPEKIAAVVAHITTPKPKP